MSGTLGLAKGAVGGCGIFPLCVVLILLHANVNVSRALETNGKNTESPRSPHLLPGDIHVQRERDVNRHSQAVGPGLQRPPPVVTDALLAAFLKRAEELLDNGGNWKILSKADDCSVHARPRAGHSSDWEYAVVGGFADLSAASYLTTLHSIPFRRAWDDSVKELELLEVRRVLTDSAAVEKQSSRNDLTGPVLGKQHYAVGGVEFEETVYWRMAFPWPVKDRDFVFARRLRAYGDRASTQLNSGVYALVFGQKSTQHEARPETEDAIRIQEYEAAVVAFPSNEERNPRRAGVKYVAFHYDRSNSPVPSWVRSYFAAHSLPSSMKTMHAAALACVSNKGKVEWPERLETPRVKRLLEEKAQQLQQFAMHSQQWQPLTTGDLQKRPSPQQNAVRESPIRGCTNRSETDGRTLHRPLNASFRPKAAVTQVNVQALLESSNHPSCPLPSLSTIVVLTGFPEACSTAAAAVHAGGLVWRERCWRGSSNHNSSHSTSPPFTLPPSVQASMDPKCATKKGTPPFLAWPNVSPQVTPNHRRDYKYSKRAHWVPEEPLSTAVSNGKGHRAVADQERWSCPGFPAFATANAFRWSVLLLGSRGLSSASCSCCVWDGSEYRVQQEKRPRALSRSQARLGTESRCTRSVLSGLTCGHPALRKAAVFGVTSRLKLLPRDTNKEGSAWQPVWGRGFSPGDK